MGKWAIPARDLSDDFTIAECRRVEFEGELRPELGRVALLAQLGKGAMGVVYYGVNPRLGTDVAVKVLPRGLVAQDPGMVERFSREARLAARVDSENVVRVLDYDEDSASGCYYIVMEYVKGLSAAAWRSRVAPNTDEARALDVCIGATRGLALAHKAGIVHRDIKPDNILIPLDDRGRLAHHKAKLADLGIARADAGEASLTGTRIAMGTPGYLAPEQATDAKRAKYPADVFGMAATLYALLTGKAPFAGSGPSDSLVRTVQGRYPPLPEIRPDVSPATVAVIVRNLQVKPDRRMADAAELLEALETARARVQEAHSTDSSRSGRKKTGPTGAPDTGGGEAATRIEPAVDAAPAGRSPQAEATGAFADGQGAAAEPTPCTAEPTRAEPSPVPPPPPPPPARSPAPPPAEPAPQPAPRATPLPATPPAEPQEEESLAPYRAAPAARSRPAPVQRPAAAPATRPASADAATVVLPRPQLLGNPTEPSGVAMQSLTIMPTCLPVASPFGNGALLVRGGPPGALVILADPDDDDCGVVLELDDAGRARPALVPAGTYKLAASCDGFETYEGAVTIAPGPPTPVIIRMRERESRFSVDSAPSGATVVLDGKAVGTTPIVGFAVRPGRHQVTLCMPRFEGRQVEFTVLGARHERLGAIELVPWGEVDATQLQEGVVASVNGRRIRGRAAIPPGPKTVVLDREHHASQRIPVDVATGTTFVIRAEDWTSYQARLDLSAVEGDVLATADGRDVEEIASFPENRTVTVEFRKAGHETQVHRVDVRLGATVTAAPGPWRPLPGSVDLSLLDSDVTAQIGDVRVRHDDSIDVGTQVIRLDRAGHQSQFVQVRVKPGRPTRLRAGPWETSTLADIESWIAADSGSRIQAVERALARVPGFVLDEMDTFHCGGAVHEVAVLTDGRTGIRFVLLPAGTFEMGSPVGEAHRLDVESCHQVTLSQPLLVARTPVTQRVWREVMGTDPARFKGAERPVDSVTWDDAVAFCKETNLALPTEAEWEYAARAGTTTQFCFGDDPDDLDLHAWCEHNSGNATRAVAMREPNAFGLYDVHGNVWEWCQDFFGPYPAGPATDPTGPTDGDERVLRGGSWNFSPWFARSAFRRSQAPRMRSFSVGFRPVRRLTGS